jgi:hypothetical protein
MFAPSKLFPLLVTAIFAVSAPAPTGAAAICKLSDQEYFDQLTKLDSWKTLYAFYNANLADCPDDGVYAEGYSDVVVQLLAKHWETTRQFQIRATYDAQFRAFVLSHIDATTDEGDLKQVLHNARTQCPAGDSTLCKDIAARAEAAIRDL